VRVWIDMSNSPHPLLFAPVARMLEEDSHEVLVTARDNAQTVALTLERWPQAEVIGTPSPPGRARKGVVIAARVAALRRWAKRSRPDLAISHNSYAQVLAARSLGVETASAMDYEHQPVNHVAFRFANRVVLPRPFPTGRARHYGASPRKTIRYEGLKEEIYLGDFEPAPRVLEDLGIERQRRALIVARTPPSGAWYHRGRNALFERILDRLAAREDCVCVVLPRGAEDRRALAGRRGLIVPKRAIDSRSLIHSADAFIGAGGTMTRESALLGVPTVSVYTARRPAVDVELADRGLLRFASSDAEVGEIGSWGGEPRPVDELRRRSREVAGSFTRGLLGETA
jgi:predicted glycosyltransferase